jgi:AraC-like DNA-binding protein
MGENNTDIRETHIIGRETRETIVSPRMCSALVAHGISLAGLTEADREFCFARPCPVSAQILVCVAGQGQVLLDGAWVASLPGGAYLTPPGAAHAYRSLPGVNWRVAWVQYQRPEPHGSWSEILTPTLRAVDPRLVASAIEGLYRECMSAAEPALLREWANLLHAYAARMLASVTLEPRLRRLWEIVDGDLALGWTVATLAAQAGMSDEHLRRLCQQQLGTSPMRYVRHLRMRRADVLLESTGCTVADVAGLVGYENPFAFSTAFTRDLGRTPSQNRKSTAASRESNAFLRGNPPP